MHKDDPSEYEIEEWCLTKVNKASIPECIWQQQKSTKIKPVRINWVSIIVKTANFIEGSTILKRYRHQTTYHSDLKQLR